MSTDSNATTCPGCVIAVEIYISVVRGTIKATKPPVLNPSDAVESLRSTDWANVVDLDYLKEQAQDGRGLRIYAAEQWEAR